MSEDRDNGPPDGNGHRPERDALVVLVVEDDDMVWGATAPILHRAGYEVLEAASAEEALICMQLNGQRVSLVLSDVIMPKQTGYDLGQAVRAQWPETHVVLISGYTPVAMDRHGIGITDFHLLQKPVADLAGVIGELIGPAQPV